MTVTCEYIKVMFDAQTWPQNRAKGDRVRITFSDRLFLRALETHWVTTAKSCASVWIKNDFWRVWDDVSCLTHKQHYENFTHWLLVSKTNNCCILYTSEELFLVLSCYSFKSYGNLWSFDILDWIIVCAHCLYGFLWVIKQLRNTSEDYTIKGCTLIIVFVVKSQIIVCQECSQGERKAQSLPQVRIQRSEVWHFQPVHHYHQTCFTKMRLKWVTCHQGTCVRCQFRT